MEKRKITKGQIMISVATIVGSVIVAIIGMWGTVSTKTSQIDTKVQVMEERENNHFLETNKRLDSIERKIDTLIEIRKTTK